MNIVIITSGYLPIPPVKGGAVEQLIEYFLIDNEINKKHNITIYSIKDDRASQKNEYKNCRVEYINTDSVLYKVKRILRKIINLVPNIYIGNEYISNVKKCMKGLEIDTVDAFIIENSPEFILTLPKKIRSKSILHLHNDFLNKTTKLNKKILNNYGAIFTISNFIKNRVEEIEKSYKIKTLYNGVDLERFNKKLFNREKIRRAYNINNFEKVIMFSGRLVEEKGVEELIKAFVNIPRTYNVKLLIVGGKNYSDNKDDLYIRKLKSIAKNYEDRIIFTGFIDYEDMPKLYSIADIGIIPSSCNEAFNLTTIEYMQNSIPVIVSSKGAMKELINKDCGIVLEYNEKFVLSLKESIIKLLDDELRENMGFYAYKQAQKYSKEIYVEKFNYLLDKFEMEIYRHDK